VIEPAASAPVAPGLGPPAIPLRIVDARRLDRTYRDALKPGELMNDRQGRTHQLPRYFYEVPSWDIAHALQLSRHFTLSEFIQNDLHEAAPLRAFPRYVPCAVTLLALALEQFRDAVNDYVHIAANGGYRSPSHALSTLATPHSWAAAVNIYQIGDTRLDTSEALERYGALALTAMPGVYVRPFGNTQGFTDDHLHLDFGFVTVVPRGTPLDAYNARIGSDQP
jgi:hypothetical protein